MDPCVQKRTRPAQVTGKVIKRSHPSDDSYENKSHKPRLVDEIVVNHDLESVPDWSEEVEAILEIEMLEKTKGKKLPTSIVESVARYETVQVQYELDEYNPTNPLFGRKKETLSLSHGMDSDRVPVLEAVCGVHER